MAGYPLGGDSLSITKGIVSRVTMTRYAHASNKLLGIQIDAAINPGNSGGPAFADLDTGKVGGVPLHTFIGMAMQIWHGLGCMPNVFHAEVVLCSEVRQCQGRPCMRSEGTLRAVPGIARLHFPMARLPHPCHFCMLACMSSGRLSAAVSGRLSAAPLSLPIVYWPTHLMH